MTEDQQKEALSKEFLRILAFGHGFKVLECPLDHGVDVIVCPVSIREEPNGRTRYLDSQHKLEFQLKSTTPAGIVDLPGEVKFDLEAKTFNDLVHRRNDPLPLHLFIVVLNDSPPACMDLTQTSLGLLAHAYWFLPEEDATSTANTSTIRIAIPKTNRVGLDFIRERYIDLGIAL
jgi:hypothetical protein